MTIPNITPVEAAEILNVCDKTVRAWMKSGRLQAVKVGGPYRTTKEWIEASLVPVAIPRPDRGQRTQQSMVKPSDKDSKPCSTSTCRARNGDGFKVSSDAYRYLSTLAWQRDHAILLEFSKELQPLCKRQGNLRRVAEQFGLDRRAGSRPPKSEEPSPELPN